MTLTQAHMTVEAVLPPKTDWCIQVQCWNYSSGDQKVMRFGIWDGDRNYNGLTLDEAVGYFLQHHKTKNDPQPSADMLFDEAGAMTPEASYPAMKETVERVDAGPIDKYPDLHCNHEFVTSFTRKSIQCRRCKKFVRMTEAKNVPLDTIP